MMRVFWVSVCALSLLVVSAVSPAFAAGSSDSIAATLKPTLIECSDNLAPGYCRLDVNVFRSKTGTWETSEIVTIALRWHAAGDAVKTEYAFQAISGEVVKVVEGLTVIRFRLPLHGLPPGLVSDAGQERVLRLLPEGVMEVAVPGKQAGLRTALK